MTAKDLEAQPSEEPKTKKSGAMPEKTSYRERRGK